MPLPSRPKRYSVTPTLASRVPWANPEWSGGLACVTAAEYAAVVGSTFAARQLDLAKAMRDASSTIAPGHLKDFDWKVQVRERAAEPVPSALGL